MRVRKMLEGLPQNILEWAVREGVACTALTQFAAQGPLPASAVIIVYRRESRAVCSTCIFMSQTDYKMTSNSALEMLALRVLKVISEQEDLTFPRLEDGAKQPGFRAVPCDELLEEDVDPAVKVAAGLACLRAFLAGEHVETWTLEEEVKRITRKKTSQSWREWIGGKLPWGKRRQERV